MGWAWALATLSFLVTSWNNFIATSINKYTIAVKKDIWIRKACLYSLRPWLCLMKVFLEFGVQGLDSYRLWSVRTSLSRQRKAEARIC